MKTRSPRKLAATWRATVSTIRVYTLMPVPLDSAQCADVDRIRCLRVQSVPRPRRIPSSSSVSHYTSALACQRQPF